MTLIVTVFRESALKNSPIAVMKNIVKLSTKRRIVLAVAEEDPKEFHRQTGEFLQVCTVR